MLDLQELKKSKNIVELLDDQELARVGKQVISGYKIDEDSRAEWKELVDKALAIVEQKMEVKNHPWEGAANIKYPLIKDAAIDYASKTIPEIIQNEDVVKCSTSGADPDGSKFARAQRVSKYMSYQLAVESPDWETGTDKLLQVLPVLGTVFKKTYYSPIEDRVISDLCVPDKICVNYNTQSLETARRITHKITLYQNDIIERQRSGLFTKNIDPESLRPVHVDSEDEDYPVELLEQHCWYDLDEDGYKEPYIVTVHEESQQVFRIVNRFKGIEKKDGEVVRITPIEYFTDFHFLRSSDGGFYSMGFGTLLLPLNAAINSVINQLIDAGTLNNMQGGLIGRGVRLRAGDTAFKMGEWKSVDVASGHDLKDNVFALPTKEPSQTLLKLLELLIAAGKELSSTTDINQGRQQAQNVATGTVQALIEQGTKVFIAINKRLYRSLQKEYVKVYELNNKYLDNNRYREMLNDPNAEVKKDFELNTMVVKPVADPTISSENQRFNKAAVLATLKTADPRAVDQYIVGVMNLDDQIVKMILPPKDPKAPPPPEQQKIIAEAQKLQAEVAQIAAMARLSAEEIQLKAQKGQDEAKMTQANVMESQARVAKMAKDAAHGDAKIAIAAGKMTSQETLKGKQFEHKQAVDDTGLTLKAVEAHTKAQKVVADTQIGLAKIAADEKKNEKEPKEGDK